MVLFSTRETLWGFFGNPFKIVNAPHFIWEWFFMPMAANEPSVKF